MAAGDVVIHGHSGRSHRGVRLVWGQVTLDGGNPTPIDLAPYMSVCLGGAVSIQGSTAPGDDPSLVTCAASGDDLNVYAWKNTGGTDPTLVASTDNARIVNFIAWGNP